MQAIQLVDRLRDAVQEWSNTDRHEDILYSQMNTPSYKTACHIVHELKPFISYIKYKPVEREVLPSLVDIRSVTQIQYLYDYAPFMVYHVLNTDARYKHILGLSDCMCTVCIDAGRTDGATKSTLVAELKSCVQRLSEHNINHLFDNQEEYFAIKADFKVIADKLMVYLPKRFLKYGPFDNSITMPRLVEYLTQADESLYAYQWL